MSMASMPHRLLAVVSLELDDAELASRLEHFPCSGSSASLPSWLGGSRCAADPRPRATLAASLGCVDAPAKAVDVISTVSEPRPHVRMVLPGVASLLVPHARLQLGGECLSMPVLAQLLVSMSADADHDWTAVHAAPARAASAPVEVSALAKLTIPALDMQRAGYVLATPPSPASVLTALDEDPWHADETLEGSSDGEDGEEELGSESDTAAAIASAALKAGECEAGTKATPFVLCSALPASGMPIALSALEQSSLFFVLCVSRLRAAVLSAETASSSIPPKAPAGEFTAKASRPVSARRAGAIGSSTAHAQLLDTASLVPVPFELWSVEEAPTAPPLTPRLLESQRAAATMKLRSGKNGSRRKAGKK